MNEEEKPSPPNIAPLPSNADSRTLEVARALDSSESPEPQSPEPSSTGSAEQGDQRWIPLSEIARQFREQRGPIQPSPQPKREFQRQWSLYLKRTIIAIGITTVVLGSSAALAIRRYFNTDFRHMYFVDCYALPPNDDNLKRNIQEQPGVNKVAVTRWASDVYSYNEAAKSVVITFDLKGSIWRHSVLSDFNRLSYERPVINRALFLVAEGEDCWTNHIVNWFRCDD